MARRTVGRGTGPIGRGRAVAALLVAAVLAVAGPAHGQAMPRGFTDPQLVLGTGGHGALVRALAFAPDGSFLVSGGLDKVVNLWDLRDGRPRRTATIRLPVWRGLGGAVYAMALAGPELADGDGGRLLAVAGYGPSSTGGDVFLYRVPGRPDRPDGDLIAALPTGDSRDPVERRAGHTDVVQALAIARDGRTLASAGGDGTIHLWDLADPAAARHLGILVGHRADVRALAFAPNGSRLFSGGADGLLRLWDVAARRLVRATPTPDPSVKLADGRVVNDPEGIAINTLAVGPAGRLVAIGRENGLIETYAAATLADRKILPVPPEPTGPVEALTIAPDGRTLAVTALKTRLTSPAERPDPTCVVHERRIADGAIVKVHAPTTNLARALAYDPTGRFLAVAGGDEQPIRLTDRQSGATEQLIGRGRSVWGVGFVGGSSVVAFARDRSPAPAFEGFDFADRRFVTVAPGTVSGPVATYQGWAARPVDLHTYEAVAPPGGRSFRIALDRKNERRWWAATFLPPGPGHDGPALAVSCEGGVAIHRLSDGRRTRFLSGHGAAVYALAPSPDGRWLATGSADQTVRLWPLAGCDAPAPLGAAIGPDSVVAAVEPGGFADLAGLKPGDRVEAFHVGTETIAPAAFAAKLAATPPGPLVWFEVRRAGEPDPLTLGTTRRAAPALSLFPAVDGEWVAWRPDGTYDTSADGDRKFLGWLRNHVPITKSPDYAPAGVYEASLRNGAALSAMLDAAGGPAAGAVPVPVPAPPPTIALLTPLPAIGAAPAEIRARIAAGPGAALVEEKVRVFVGTRAVPAKLAPAAEGGLELVALVDPGTAPTNLTIEATDDADLTGKLTAELPPPAAPLPPPPPAAGPRLVVRTVGVDKFAGPGLPPIAYAGRDAEALERFFVEPPGRPAPFPADRVDRRHLTGADATATALADDLKDLVQRTEDGRLDRGDLVVVAIETHGLRVGPAGKLALLGADADAPPAAAEAPGAVDQEAVSGALGRLAEYGCTVVLLIDTAHEDLPAGLDARATEWVRDLYQRRGVIAFVASKHGPGRRNTSTQQGMFTQAILDSLSDLGLVRPLADPSAPVTLADFRAAVLRRVSEMTAGTQQAGGYLPERLNDRQPLWPPGR